eukprot:scaffold128756_cov24-Prasinocladus_malaysianus.AAC.1
MFSPSIAFTATRICSRHDFGVSAALSVYKPDLARAAGLRPLLLCPRRPGNAPATARLDPCDQFPGGALTPAVAPPRSPGARQGLGPLAGPHGSQLPGE